MVLNSEVLRVPGMIEATLHARAGQVRELFQASFHTIHHPSASQPGTNLIAFPAAAWSIFIKRLFRSGGWDLQRYCAPTHTKGRLSARRRFRWTESILGCRPLLCEPTPARWSATLYSPSRQFTLPHQTAV
jgi:hypothetical protein